MSKTITLIHDEASPRTMTVGGEQWERMMRPCADGIHPERGDWYAAHLSACGYKMADGSPITAAALRAA